MDFNTLVGNAETRYFSRGRFALAAGLGLLDLPAGAPILLPAFICRDLLAAIHAAGGTPVFYPVNEHLAPALPPEEWPEAAAVLAVNYFGFPQSLEVFQSYCRRTGALLIEDNAHGLLSRDPQGQFLGTRGSLGIFSLRKTVPVPDGAALVVNDEVLRDRLSAQLPPDRSHQHRAFALKRRLAQTPIIGNTALRLAVAATRCWRTLRTGTAIPQSDDDIETHIPGTPAPHAGLIEALTAFKSDAECHRRQALYSEVDTRLKQIGVPPVFPTLPDHTVPYGMPFFGDAADRQRVNAAVRALHLEAFPWPELPTAIAPTAPAHYRNVCWVNFLDLH